MFAALMLLPLPIAVMKEDHTSRFKKRFILIYSLLTGFLLSVLICSQIISAETHENWNNAIRWTIYAFGFLLLMNAFALWPLFIHCMKWFEKAHHDANKRE